MTKQAKIVNDVILDDNTDKDVVKIAELNKESLNIVDTKTEVETFFTDDPIYKNQYYELRRKSYREDWGFNHFDKLESKFDENSRIAVAVIDGKVVGGVRLMISNECKYLSNEIPGTQFEYKKFIAKYDKRENLVIAEISGVVVAKGYRDSLVLDKLFSFFNKKSKKFGVNYVFGVTIPLLCRRHRMALKRIGYHLEIVINYPWERKKIYNYKKMFLVYLKLQ